MNRFFLALGSCALALVALLPACTTRTFMSPPPDAGGGGGGGTQCTAARKTHLVPISKVSTGAVKVVSFEKSGVLTIYVDASAGGANEAGRTPRIYIKLSGERVNVDDNAAFDSVEWDLALKRVDIFTNSGDAGPGKGGAVVLQKDFAAVTSADADAALVAPEKFFDDDCVGRKDEASFIITTFSGWYNYAVGAGPSVRPGITYIVLGADGVRRYKVGIVSYTAQADGGLAGPATGFFLLKVANL